MPGIGCTKHVTERLEDALFREEFGPTTSPEEDWAKRFKKCFNDEGFQPDCSNVIKYGLF